MARPQPPKAVSSPSREQGRQSSLRFMTQECSLPELPTLPLLGFLRHRDPVSGQAQPAFFIVRAVRLLSLFATFIGHLAEAVCVSIERRKSKTGHCRFVNRPLTIKTGQIQKSAMEQFVGWNFWNCWVRSPAASVSPI